jgi:DNA-binding MarR family transcriptional regulator
MEQAKLSAITDDIVSVKPLFYKAFGRPLCQDSDITPGAYYVLLLLVKDIELSMSEIGEKLFISKPNVTALINQLMEEGFTERLPDKQDRRIIKIRLTKKGTAFVEKNKKVFRQQINEKLLSLSEKELNKFVSSLQTIMKILTKISAIKNQ